MTATPNPRDFAIPSGDELRALRDACGLNQQTVALRAGVSAASLRRWEQGERAPSVRSLRRVLAVYRGAWDGEVVEAAPDDADDGDDSATTSPTPVEDGACECPLCDAAFVKGYHVTEHIRADHGPEDVGLEPAPAPEVAADD
jgi:transcriptional regulator with XRE-family HTH domain